jgi:hypothetical protein
MIIDFIRNWHPGASRTPSGFYRNLSLKPRIDAFTGKSTGTWLPPAQNSQTDTDRQDSLGSTPGVDRAQLD